MQPGQAHEADPSVMSSSATFVQTEANYPDFPPVEDDDVLIGDTVRREETKRPKNWSARDEIARYARIKKRTEEEWSARAVAASHFQQSKPQQSTVASQTTSTPISLREQQQQQHQQSGAGVGTAPSHHPPPSSQPPPPSLTGTNNAGHTTTMPPREITPVPPLAASAAGEGSSRGKVKMTTYDMDESTLRVTIQNFSKMTDTLCSESKRISDVPWRIMVMPKQHMVQKKSQKCMGFFLQCCPDNTFSDQWSCHAVAEMRLISEKSTVQNFVRKTTHIYTSKENDWGYSCFMTWADVLDENQGYIKNDQVTLEISVKADPPKNMMTREEFRKTLDRWYELANLQKGRGMIDKALEANGQAIANCKDKDDEYREKLEQQKEELVQQKLLESIQRIELGKDPSRPAETSTCPTSLRQALTGAQKTIAGAKEKRHANGTAKKERRGAAVAKQMRKKVEANRTDKQKKANSSNEDLRKENDGEKKSISTNTTQTGQENVVKSGGGVANPNTNTKSCVKHPPEPDTLLQIALEQKKNQTQQQLTGQQLQTQRTNLATPKQQHQSAKDTVDNQPFDVEDDEQSEMDSNDDPHNELNNDDPVGHDDGDECSENSEDYDTEGEMDGLEGDDGREGDEEGTYEDEEEDDEDDDDDEEEENRLMENELVSSGVVSQSMMYAYDAECPNAFMRISSLEMVKEGKSRSVSCQTTFSHHVDDELPSDPTVAAMYEPERYIHRESRLHHVRRTGLCIPSFVDPPQSFHMPSIRQKLTATRKARRMQNSTTSADGFNQATINMDEAAVSMSEGDFLDISRFPDSIFDGSDGSLVGRDVAGVGRDAARVFVDERVYLTPQQESMGELVTLGMSCLNAQRFLGRTEELFNIIDTIYDIDVVKVSMMKIFPNRKRDDKPRAQDPKLIAPSLIKNSIFNISDGEDGNDEGALPNETSDQRKERRRRTKMAAAVSEFFPDTDFENTEEETINVLRSLFGKELLAYNHQMTVLMERVEMMIALTEDFRVALDSKEARKTMEMIKRSEAKAVELEAKVKSLEANVNRERESKKKVEQEKTAVTERADEEKARADNLGQQLKEKRNEMRKLEKKQRQDESRLAELQVEYADMEEKMKTAKREMDAFKKKAVEERNKARKDLEKAQETIRRMENELLEKDQEKEREKNANDARIRKMAHEEAAALKERKSIEAKLTAATERAKKAEIGQLEIELSTGLKVLERALADATKQEEAYETLLKSARSPVDLEVNKKALAEWKAVRAEITSSISRAKTDYTAALDSIKSGAKTLATVTKPTVSSPPQAPKTLAPRPTAAPSLPATASVAPAIATVLPTTAAPAPPMTAGVSHVPPVTPNSIGMGAGHSINASTASAPIVPPTPAAGVIGQPRTPVPSRERQTYHSSPVRAASMAPQLSTPSSSYGRSSSPPLSQLAHESPVKTLPPIGVRPMNHVNSVTSSSSTASSGSGAGQGLGGSSNNQSSNHVFPSGGHSGVGLGPSSTNSFLTSFSRGDSSAAGSVWHPLSSNTTWEPFSGFTSGFTAPASSNQQQSLNNHHHGVNQGTSLSSQRAPAPGPFSLSGTGVTGGNGSSMMTGGPSSSISAGSSTRSTPFAPYEHGLSHELAQLSWNEPAYGGSRAPVPGSGGPGGQAPPPGWTPGWGSAPLGAPGSQQQQQQQQASAANQYRSALFNS